jgi:glycosyltransferase involved in cell wall biosynthesis
VRILVVSTAFPRDADDPTVKWLAEAIRRLRARGYAIEVFTSAYKGGGNTSLDGIPIHRFRYFFRKWENLTHEESAPDRMRRSLFYAILPAFYLLFGSIAMWRLQRREQYDVVHVHWPLPHALFAWVARVARRKTRLIMQFYSIELRWVNERIAILRGFLRRAIRTADRVVAISTATGREVTALAGSDIPIEIIPYAVGMPEHKALPHDTATVLYVGRLVERKGVAYLIDAAASLPGARIVIIGDGPEREALEARATERGVTDRVEFRGWVTPGELDAAYSSATVFALPAVVDKRGDTEGLGMVLLEAMSYYVPVVTTALGGITDIVDNEKTGLIVPPNDSDALAVALRRLIDDRALAAKLGSAGEKMIELKFSWPRIIDQFSGLYDSLDPDRRVG